MHKPAENITVREKSIAVDADKTIGYEFNGIIKKMIDILYIPLLNNIPTGFQSFIKKSHRSAKEVMDNATTHKAIEILYLDGEPRYTKSPMQKFFYHIWFKTTNNPKAIRNRLKAVKREIHTAAQKLVDENKDISLLSIAAGSARGVIEVFEKMNCGDRSVRISFLDKNPEANQYSQDIVMEKGLSERFNFKWIVDTANSFPYYFTPESTPNIVEMVGLMDYFDDEAVMRIFKTIYDNMQKGGTFITANISHNREKRFVTKVVGWKMIYRDPQEFITFALSAGFKEENIRVFFEPMKIHFLMVATK